MLLGMALLVLARSAAVAQAQADVNCDGLVSRDDVSALVDLIFGDASSDCGAGDVNGDGQIGAADIIALLGVLNPPTGPVLTFLGLAGADGKATTPLGTVNGTAVFFRNTGAGFQLVVEGRAGLSGQAPGVMTFNSDASNPSRRPDIQIESSAPLGDGSAAVCDGGVPAINPSDFGLSQVVANALNDLACHLPQAVTSPSFACTQDGFGTPRFMGSGTQTQFCLLVPRTLEFPSGTTMLSVRWRDTAGNLGPLYRLLLQVGSGPMPPTFTASPTAPATATPTPTSTATAPPTATASASRTPTRTRTPIPAPVTATATASFTNTAGRTATPTTTRTFATPPTATATRPQTSPTPTSQTPRFSASPTATPSATRTATQPRSQTSTATPTLSPTPPPAATSTRTATRTPTPPFTASATVTATASRTPTVTRTRTPLPTVTRSPTSTRTPTVTPSATVTFAGPSGPLITFLGLTRADDTLVKSTETTAAGVPIFIRPTGAGFSLVVEGQAGPSGAAVGRSAFDASGASFADLQIEVSQPLGNGSPAVCDRSGPTAGGVPAVDPPSFDVTPAHTAASNDLSCRFVNGSDAAVARNRDEACVLFPSGDFQFVNPSSTVQFCGFVTGVMEFQPGDTLVTVRLRDVSGNPGAPAQMVVRINP